MVMWVHVTWSIDGPVHFPKYGSFRSSIIRLEHHDNTNLHFVIFRQFSFLVKLVSKTSFERLTNRTTAIKNYGKRDFVSVSISVSKKTVHIFSLLSTMMNANRSSNAFQKIRGGSGEVIKARWSYGTKKELVLKPFNNDVYLHFYDDSKEDSKGERRYLPLSYQQYMELVRKEGEITRIREDLLSVSVSIMLFLFLIHKKQSCLLLIIISNHITIWELYFRILIKTDKCGEEILPKWKSWLETHV